MGFFRRKKAAERKDYDRENLKPVLHCSICNGEQVAGFKDLRTGEFQEVMYVRSEEELKEFLNLYGIDKIEKEY